MILFHMPDPSKNKFHRSQHWSVIKGIPMLSAALRPGIGGVPITNPDDPPHKQPSLYPPYEGPLIPAWLAYDKNVLCFFAYFKESLHEVYQSPYQVRKVKILFYLEDGTIQVSEPRTDNSGLSQGCIVSRQRVPKPAPCQYEFLSILDLNVNQTVRIFDRVYQITGCDEFTRNFLNKAGISVSDPTETPVDPGLRLREKSATLSFPKKPSVNIDNLAQFLKNDRKVLKFQAYWDDRESAFGDLRDLELYYFLADDTIQLKELFPRNSGRDAPATFLTRQKIPKNWNGCTPMGQKTPYTVLNVLGGILTGGRFIADCLALDDNQIQYYKDRDLSIGAQINVFGREITIVDCDLFTKEYYRVKYGVENFSPIQKPFINNNNNFKSIKPRDQRVLPIFNGWGTHEDSEGNCTSTEPKPPTRDFKKFIQLDGKNLRFGAKMLSSIKENNGRIFIITYYLSDDTLSVYELGTRNSGFLGGEFFKRGKFNLPHQNWFTSERPKQYLAQHLYIGATITLNDFKFHLVTADEYGLKYMEDHPFEFSKSNIDIIMNKLREAVRLKYKEFIAKYLDQICNSKTEMGKNISIASFDTMRTALIDALGDDITEHEIVTLVRYFSAEQKPKTICNREVVRSTVHWELGRNLWDDLSRFKEHLYHLDPMQCGYMDESCLRSTILACRLPLKPSLVTDMFSVLNKNECGEINISDLIYFIDRFTNKSIPAKPTVLSQVCPDVPFSQAGRLVDWNCFLTKLGLEDDLKKESE